MANQKQSKGDKKAARAKNHQFRGMGKIRGSHGKRHCTPIARYLRTGIRDHACTGS